MNERDFKERLSRIEDKLDQVIEHNAQIQVNTERIRGLSWQIRTLYGIMIAGISGFFINLFKV